MYIHDYTEVELIAYLLYNLPITHMTYSTNRRQGKCVLRLRVKKKMRLHASSLQQTRIHALCMQVRVMLFSIPTKLLAEV